MTQMKKAESLPALLEEREIVNYCEHHMDDIDKLRLELQRVNDLNKAYQEEIEELKEQIMRMRRKEMEVMKRKNLCSKMCMCIQ